MKKLLLAAVMAVAAIAPAMAEPETVKTLYSGEPKEVTWANTLTIPASEFAEGVEIGNYIYITFSQTTDVIEIKANGTWLPGSRLTVLGDNSTDFKAYITEGMLDALKEYGLEICGAKFTVTGVSVCNDGFVMPEGAIWGGYFWVEAWNTLEIFKSALAAYDGQRYMDIYLEANYDTYFMKVLTQWEPAIVWADNDQVTKTGTKATVDLQNVDVQALLNGPQSALMIQSNPEGGNPFNITAVALRKDSSTSLSVVAVGEETPADVYNLQGMRVLSGVTVAEAQAQLPAGLYIAAGRKFLVK